MAEKSILWTAPSTGDGAAGYSSTEATRMFRNLVGATQNEGVLPTIDNELAPTGSTSPIAVDTGSAFVYGFFYWNDASQTVAVPTPNSGTTGHRIVLRASWPNSTVRLTLISSNDGDPSIPELTHASGTIWEIPIASLTITTGGSITLTDEREFIHMGMNVSSEMIPDGEITHDKIEDRTRRFFVLAFENYDFTPNEAIKRENRLDFGWEVSDYDIVTVYASFKCPDDFVEDLKIKPLGWMVGSGSGNIYHQVLVKYGAAGEEFDNHVTNEDEEWSFYNITRGKINAFPAIELEFLAPGDYVTIEFTRDATTATAKDTLKGKHLQLPGFLVEYVASH